MTTLETRLIMKKKTDNHEGDSDSFHQPSHLVCDPFRSPKPNALDYGEWVSSPVLCLKRVVNEKPEIIIVRIRAAAIGIRSALLELCMALKQTDGTRSIPILVLLDAKHRKLLEDLGCAGVDYILYCDDVSDDDEFTGRLVRNLNSGDSLAHQRDMLCPCLNYLKTDANHEMTVCGAYLNRLVLGSDRLNNLCHTPTHRHCEYYLNPKGRS